MLTLDLKRLLWPRPLPPSLHLAEQFLTSASRNPTVYTRKVKIAAYWPTRNLSREYVAMVYVMFLNNGPCSLKLQAEKILQDKLPKKMNLLPR